MPELRKDPIISRWVIISTERGKRPHDFVVEPEVTKGGFCPFCPGNEHTTPPEIMAYRPAGQPANSPGWTVRVVSNKFPALVIEGELDRRGEGMYDLMNGIGAHEVIIENPNHQATLSTLTIPQFADVLYAYRDRIRDLSRDPRFRYILIFKNSGRAAGASLEHSHSQLIGLPIVPELVQEELSGSLMHYRLKERCVFCDMIRQELQQGVRVVLENELFVAICPFAPRSPFEIWILPKKHHSSYIDMLDKEYLKLAELFSPVLRRLDVALNRAPYNFILHTAPVRETHMEHYHWHFEIMPKLTLMAGFEWGSGFFINPTPPEDAARYLREVQLEEAAPPAGESTT
ncbi:galactose-1-phosphate uridylyltransferase [Desulfobacca acetoxidans]|uniref:Galactose-1-phosphate uridylyltransferase n=1 Tax=Desulfobacca acetoxidans (strain ATCC 700848 / DSM 11109 / ASRB2) TaxID=880072 RepID=F2NFW5_DESAR|nr:galactose-1-phosphate uridylyltransferase [Desulfobacca acetoxidans]AEB10234.1 galactose-1-phosphate uridylyltransferase [Desulfobacca acetoxidans DSM 11109]